uniref:Uncharacterized protein n=1 Tax=Odontella aurita TaxID=265563 RepID=A0A7S4K982_9STRA|mmetsp:Transcript_7332/g.21637  ORF Transcript_7332/g.21637 Transcript_7332/m.21637 type:complete len:443 (+) Transcript_7332:351-1679(+)|eukprot:CAMPEP_0113558738 /NCGR_PEP_ID=MMETSP0015_2-20120614/18515_1 /TAXON_ID=2838 /ORGANISM="Odontella" /LENGTH=442 /DNA_ID=CAMNT_0000460311 /DNA_START=275 /DNA_END=1603 /DNA_ORIENTATION=- /assembly_acc=CAM_ASM_000160
MKAWDDINAVLALLWLIFAVANVRALQAISSGTARMVRSTRTHRPVLTVCHPLTTRSAFTGDQREEMHLDEGQFSLFDRPFAMLSADAIFSQTYMSPLVYIRDMLSYGDDCFHGHKVNNEAVGNEKETVVFCGDVHEDTVRFASRVLEGLPMAHLRTTQSGKILCCVNESMESIVENNSKTAIMKLLDGAVAALQSDNGRSRKVPRLVLVAYSTACIDVSVALRSWIDRKHSCQEGEKLLSDAVTVVTLGALSNKLPSGPAYIHVSMSDDPYVEALGITRRASWDQGGRDAQYLHAYSPYYYLRSFHHFDDEVRKLKMGGQGIPMRLDNDAHNLRACLVQWLSIVMRVNGARSFRFLYDVMVTGSLNNPYNLEEEVLPAMIVATGGHEWLWNPLQSLGKDYDDTDCIPMDEDEARMVLELQYGYDAFDEIAEYMRDMNDTWR